MGKFKNAILKISEGNIQGKHPRAFLIWYAQGHSPCILPMGRILNCILAFFHEENNKIF
jgi:hypothetical protein